MFIYFHSSSSKFKVEEAFIGYQKDTPAAVIFKATKHCRQVKECGSGKGILMPSVLGSISIDDLKCQKEGSEYWKNAVSSVADLDKNYGINSNLALFNFVSAILHEMLLD